MCSRRGGFMSRAFTLVELLVVIGIVTVLIAVLLPVLGKARDQANRVKCAANLRSLGHALTMYVQQYHYYPCCEGGTRHYAVWPVRLRAFLNNNQAVFYCPSQDERCKWEKVYAGPVPRAGPDDVQFGYEVGERAIDWQTHFSYAYNCMGASSKIWGGVGHVYDGTHRGLGLLADPPFVFNSPVGHLAANRVRVPSNMIAIMDATADGRSDYLVSPAPDHKVWGWPSDIHNRGANVLFCDGHVDWYLQADLTLPEGFNSDPRYLAVRRMWNNTNEPD